MNVDWIDDSGGDCLDQFEVILDEVLVVQAGRHFLGSW